MWSHQHTGTDEQGSARSLTCKLLIVSLARFEQWLTQYLLGLTQNKLIIPTAYNKTSLTVRLIGESKLEVKGSGKQANWR